MLLPVFHIVESRHHDQLHLLRRDLFHNLARRAEASNFVIVSGPDSGVGPIRRQALATSLNTVGRFAEPIPGTFLLRSGRPLTDVRRILTSAAPDGTQLMICAPRDAKLGWTGLSSQGAEAVRAIWDAPLNPSTD